MNRYNIEKNLESQLNFYMKEINKNTGATIRIVDSNVFGDIVFKDDSNLRIHIRIKPEIINKSFKNMNNNVYNLNSVNTIERINNYIFNNPFKYNDEKVFLEISTIPFDIQYPQQNKINFYDFMHMCKKIIISNKIAFLKKDTNENILNSKKAFSKFSDLSKVSRNLSDEKLFPLLKIIGKSSFANQLKMVNELMHVVTKRVNLYEGMVPFLENDFEEKLYTCLKYYSFHEDEQRYEKDFIESLEQNFRHEKEIDLPELKNISRFETFLNLVKSEIISYGVEFNSLPVYNESHVLIQKALFDLTNFDFQSSHNSLCKLNENINDGLFLEKTLSYENNYCLNIENKKKKNFKL